MNTIGLLLPRSTYYAGLSFDLLEGFRTSLKQIGLEDVRIVSENIGFGTDKQLCYKVAEQLIMHENVRMVFAYIGHRMAQVIRPLFIATNRLLIVLDAGANIPQEWPESPNIFYHSLHNALGSYMAAQFAHRDGYVTGGMVTGYYDGGYLQTMALTTGFTDAGGTIRFNHATGYRPEDFSIEPLEQYMNAYPGSALLSIFSGDYVQWYFEQLKRLCNGQQFPVYLPPFALEETTLGEAQYPGNDLKGVAAWCLGLENEQNQQFKTAMEEAGRSANLFSLLGWEGAYIAAYLLKTYKSSVQELSLALNELSFESPRGNVIVHTSTRHTIAPMYEVSVTSDETGNCELFIGSSIGVDHLLTSYEAFTSIPIDNAVSGWYNSYTCI